MCQTREDVILSLVNRGELQISGDGKIWRVMKRHGRGVRQGGGYHLGATVTPCRKVRAEYRTRQGYLLVTTTINGVKTTASAHRLVWTYFHEKAIPPGLTINHINGVKDDNRIENLELATMSQQRRHALTVLNVNRNRPKGSAHPKTRLNESDVLLMREMRSQGAMVKDIAAKYQMKPKAVSAICGGRTWKHV